MKNNVTIETAFTALWEKIESHEIKTSNNLRLALESLSEQSGLPTLKLLVTFREWLMEKQVELNTDHGSVSFKYL